MANVTRIKAKDSNSDKSDKSNDAEISRKVSIKAKNSENKKTQASHKQALKNEEKKIREKNKADKAAKKKNIPTALKPLWIISTPFRATGRYIRDSFRELRQVRWPDRKTTWKITISVLIFVVMIAVLIMLLDAGLTFLFDKFMGGQK